jgi:acyl carrier protein
MNNIENQIIQTVKDMKLGKHANISLDSSLKDDLGLDSLSFTELLIEIEDRFEIEIDLDDPDLPKFSTLRDFENIVKSLLPK